MAPNGAHRGLHVTSEDGVVTATIDHPPLNLLDVELMR
jgi:hypothetical protein